MDEIERKKLEFIDAFNYHIGKTPRKVIADKLGVSVQYVGGVINNSVSLKLDAQTKIANKFGMSLNEFLTSAGKEPVSLEEANEMQLKINELYERLLLMSEEKSAIEKELAVAKERITQLEKQAGSDRRLSAANQ